MSLSDVSPAANPAPFVARSKWARLLEVTRAAVGYIPITSVGATVLVVSAAIAWYQGIGHEDLVLLMVSLCALAILILMLIVTVVGAFLTRRSFGGSHGGTCGALETGALTVSGFRIHLPRWLPCLDVAWQWEKERGACTADVTLDRQGSETLELVRAARRGIYKHVVRRVEVRDIFGMCRLTWHSQENAALRVLPSRGRIDELVPMMGWVSGDDISDPYGDPWGDRVDMRQYTHGDSPRMIMWKVYARSRKLMVRVNERAVAPRPRGCGYVVTDIRPHPMDEASAGVARVVLERHLLGDGWCFGADGCGDVATELDGALDVLARSGASAVADTGFPLFLQRVKTEGFGYCALFLPPRAGPWLAPVLDAMARTQLRVHVFVGIDGQSGPGAGQAGWRRLFLRDRESNGPTSRDLFEVVSKISHCTAQVYLVDRVSGQIFNNPIALLNMTAMLPRRAEEAART